MVCDLRRDPEQSAEERQKEIRAALAGLEEQLTRGTAKVVIGPQGAVAFSGWNDRRNMADTCAFRALTLTGSFALRQAIARAEAESGRRVNAGAVGNGTHSHDGGNTWHAGH